MSFFKKLNLRNWKYYWRKVDGIEEGGVFEEPFSGHAYSICRKPRYMSKEDWDKIGPLLASAPDLKREMERYLPILKWLEQSEFWHEATKGTGIASLNGYETALNKFNK